MVDLMVVQKDEMSADMMVVETVEKKVELWACCLVALKAAMMVVMKAVQLAVMMVDMSVAHSVGL